MKPEPGNLPPGLTINQWQELLVGAVSLLQNSTNPEEDIAYSRWLVEQWQLDQQRIIHERTLLIRHEADQ